MNRSKHIKRLYSSRRNNIILEHIKANINTYIIVLTIFIVGLFIGVMLVNKLSGTQTEEINNTIENSLNIIKSENKPLKKQLLTQTIIKYFIIIIIIWTLGLTFFGKYLLYFIIFVLGISFGYTTSALMICFDVWKGFLFFVSTLLLQNLIAIPTFIFLCVQGIKCHNNFKKNSNIKNILINYTVIILAVMIMLLIASIIEVYISDNILVRIVKYL